MLEFYICPVIAIAALILTIVLSVILLVSKKEKRRQMKKIKTAAVVSALTFPLMAAATIYLSQIIIIEPNYPNYIDCEIPDLTGLSYAECKTAYTGLFDLPIWEMQYSSEYPEGAIISQFPEGGIIIKRPFGSNSNIEIRCFVSKGSESDSPEKEGDT